MHKRLTIEYVIEKLYECGYTYDSDRYINAHTKFDYTCPNGHKHRMTWDKFQQGKRCPYCAGNAKLTIDIVRGNVEAFGYVFESAEYINAQTKFDYTCPNGHKHSMTYYHFQQGRRCPTCRNLNKFGKGSPLWKGGVVKLNIPLYDTYAPQLEQYDFEEVRIYMILVNAVVYKTLQVRCHNSDCRKWFRPSLIQVQNRLQVFNGIGGGSDFYCDEGCKATCSTYGQKTRRRGEDPKEKPYTKEEYDLYRQVVLEREDYKCEYCGAEATEVHHEQTQKEQPMLALDPDYGHATCKPCHYEYGHKTGTECSTGNLAKKIC